MINLADGRSKFVFSYLYSVHLKTVIVKISHFDLIICQGELSETVEECHLISYCSDH